MTLGFSTELNEKPTYFVEKIWKSLKPIDISEFISKININYISPSWKHNSLNPKLHTFRRDEKNRWKVGMIIDFFINVRTKNMFRFAPKLKVKGIQKVEIFYREHFTEGKVIRLLIDGRLIDGELSIKELHNYKGYKLNEIVQNDGFDSVEDFFEYFSDDFTGKIIHWTDLKY